MAIFSFTPSGLSFISQYLIFKIKTSNTYAKLIPEEQYTFQKILEVHRLPDKKVVFLLRPNCNTKKFASLIQ